MKKLLIPIVFVSGFFVSAQETPKKDSAKTENIQEVMISKKVFKKESDRFVYDISNSPVAKGNTSFDILKQTPMLSSTDDQTLKIAGKNNALIYLNGRKSNMDAESLVQFLKNTPAENIQKIEVITTPGSEFQVESSDGIINIVLKKKTSDGLNGNMRMANSYNKYDSPSASVSLNYRKDKLGISTNINTSEGIEAQHYVLKNGDDLAMNQSVGNVDDPNKNIGGYLNIDYQLNDNSNLALEWNSWANRSYGSSVDLFNTMKVWNDETKEFDYGYSKSKNIDNSRSYNNSVNLNYELKTDSLGSKLNVNAAYLNYKRFQNSDNRTIVSDAFMNEYWMSKQVLQQLPQIINNFSGTVDYIQKFKNDFTISVGGNYNKTKTDNDTQNITSIFDENGNLIDPKQNGMITENPLYEPNHFIYNENIYGMYLTFETKFSDKFSGKIGGRYEITNSLGTSDNAQNPEYKRIERNYNKLLPYLTLNYAINDNNNISYAFSSRMRRPSFWELNPVRNILTEDNYTQNDPFVKASTNYNQELTYMYKNSYFLVLNHSLVKDVITQVPLQRDIVKEDGKTYKELRYIRTNFGDKQEMSAMLGMNKAFFKQYWTMNFSIGVQHNRNNGSLSVDPTTGDIFPEYRNDKNTTSLLIQMSNNIRLNKNKTWFFGINGFYVDKQQIELGMLKNLMSVDLSLKKIWNNWTFAASVQDIFRTNIVEIEDEQKNGNYNYVKNDQFRRGGTISITYNFGNQKVKKVRNIESAADDIKNRTR